MVAPGPLSTVQANFLSGQSEMGAKASLLLFVLLQQPGAQRQPRPVHKRLDLGRMEEDSGQY